MIILRIQAAKSVGKRGVSVGDYKYNLTKRWDEDYEHIDEDLA